MKKFDWSNKTEIENVIASSSNITEAIKKLGLQASGSNPITFKKYALIL